MIEEKNKLEGRIQQEIVRDYNNSYCLAHHSPRNLILAIPNGMGGNKVARMLSVAKGEYPGASDLLVIHKGRVMFVEVKTNLSGSDQDPKQKLFQAHVNQCGYPYYLVRSLVEFQTLINSL